MPGPLYEDDVLTWSEHQASLLRRLARGEKVNAEIDWDHVIEEVEDVGQSELRAVRSLLARAIEHLLKIQGWPGGPVEHWRNEALTFLVDARRIWTPSMRQKVDVTALHEEALAATRAMTFGQLAPGELPAQCPFMLDDLIVDRPGVPSIEALLRKLNA